MYFNLSRDNANQAARSERSGGTAAASAITYGTPFLISATFDGANVTVRVSGQSDSTTTSTGTFGVIAYRLLRQIKDGDYGKLLLGAVLLFDSALDGTNRGLVTTYLAKYGVSP